jgi:hypothetical protein
MYKAIIKSKRKNIYILTSIIALFIIAFSAFGNIKTFDKNELLRLENILEKTKMNNTASKVELDELIAKNNNIFRHSINDVELKDNLNTFCSTLIQSNVLKECQFSNIVSPYEYSNVAKFTINTFNKVDRLILERLISQVYYIKQITKNDTGVDFEIYNKN